MEQQISELDKEFFTIYNQWQGETGGNLYNELWVIMLKAAKINLLSRLRKFGARGVNVEELIMETVCRFLPRLIEKKRHNYIPPYGPVALISMDVNYILHNDKKKQEDRESVDYDFFANMKLKEEEERECF